MSRREPAPAFVRPALLEVVVVMTAAGVAVVTALAGLHIHCTALVEFAILSAIVAASAATLLCRYVAQASGILTDYRSLELWGARLRTLSYLGLGVYALLNGALDITVPRRDTDPISYPGLICAVLAVLVVTLVLESKYRVLATTPSRSLLDSLADDAFYVTLGAITLGALSVHIFAPAWWLDTLTDAIFVAVVALRLRVFFGGESLRI